MTDLDNAVLRALKASGIRVKPLEWVPAPNICTREKAAAQADYEARILAALDVDPGALKARA